MPGNSNVAKALQEAPATQQRLKRGDFTLTNGTANARTKIASYTAESPIAFREDDVRLMLVVVEQFQTDGSGTAQTFNLSNNIIPTSNTTDFVLYEGASRVAADSVDYAADSFTYTGPGSAEYLHAFYVARNPVEIEIEKTAPKSQGKVSQVIFDGNTALLHEQNQHKEPPAMDFSGKSAFAPVVPRKWSVDIYADGPIAFAWDDSSTANAQGVTAVNAVVSLPVNRSSRDIEGLGQAVKQDIIS